MKEKTLLIMAAGMGSRFGGLKQITPVGPSGEFIIDYSIYDAKRAGFNKVVFIIKKDMYEDFVNTIGKRIEEEIKIEYAFQELTDIPEGYKLPEERVKPLGTGHALYAARHAVKEPFAIISADDFYGKEAFDELAEVLDNTEDNCVVGHQIGNTISENGSVKRGIIFEKDGYLNEIRESKVEKIDGVIHAEALNTNEEYTLEENHPVCMLLYGLRPEVFDFINEDINVFFKNADLKEQEYFLPDIIDRYMEKGNKIRVISTKSNWQGITYKEDLEKFKEYINKQIELGEYPENLWK